MDSLASTSHVLGIQEGTTRPSLCVLGIEPGALYSLGKHSTNFLGKKVINSKQAIVHGINDWTEFQFMASFRYRRVLWIELRIA